MTVLSYIFRHKLVIALVVIICVWGTIPSAAQTTSVPISALTIEDYLTVQDSRLGEVNIVLRESFISFSGIYSTARGEYFIAIQATPYVTPTNKVQLDVTQARLDQIDAAPPALQRLEEHINQVLLGLQEGIEIYELNFQPPMLMVTLQPPGATLPRVNIAQESRLILQDIFGIAVEPDAPPEGADTSQLNEADQALLDRSLAKVFEADTLRLAISAGIQAQDADESAKIAVTGIARISNVTTFGDLLFASDLTYTSTRNEEIVWRVRVEQQIIDGIVYFRGENLQTAEMTRWIATPLNSLLDDGFEVFGETIDVETLTDLDNIEIEAEQLGDLTDILQVITFITTERTDMGNQPFAQYTTRVDIAGILDSPEMMTIIFSILGRAGVEIEDLFGDDDVEMAAMLVSLARRSVVPRIELTFDRFVDTTDETLSRVEGDLLVSLTVPDEVEIRGDMRAVVAGYEESLVLMPPADALFTEDVNTLEPADVLLPPEN